MQFIRRPATWLTLAAALSAPLAQAQTQAQPQEPQAQPQAQAQPQERAQPQAQMTLQQAYQATLDYNAKLQGERAQVRAERASVDEAWAGVKPQLDATASYGRARTTQDFAQGELFQIDTYDRYDVSLNQVLYSHKNFTAISRAKRAAELAEERALGTEHEVAVEVVQAYVEIIKNQRLKDILTAEKDSHLYRLEQMEEMLGRGLTTLAQVLDARAEVDQIRAKLVEIRNNHSIALQQLSQLTGRAVDAVAPLNENRWKDIPQWLQRDWLSAALSHSARVKTAEAEVALADASHSYESANHYPELYISGRYSDNDTATTSLREEAKIELQLRIPLYSGGATSARSRAAAEREAKALAMLDYSRRQVRTEVQRLTSQLDGLHESIAALYQSLASSQAAENAAEEGFRAGVRSLGELLDAQQRRSRVEQELVSSIYQCSEMYVELLRLTGELNDGALAALQ
ncbi:membrane protein [Bacterioplanes sanyensis]|uniref:TolC family protein n=1 Tax=Bacterioplanes sanyensis TaxID=1249553 RepID=UPI001677E46D|nr:TolC family protein [Bacterioplanes sanyensis]GGY55429.1 membrane protein [Bacterioplanes sanyensis]